MDELVRVKLNGNGWEIYKSRNGFYKSNIDNEGYSTFSYSYFKKLFYQLKREEYTNNEILLGGKIND